MNQNDWEAISTDFGRISSTRPSNSHGFTVRLKFSDVTSRSRGLTRSKSHGEPKWLKLLIIFIPKSNLCYFLYSFGNHIGFKAIILCFVGSRRRSMGKNFGIFLLKKSECGVSQMQSGKEFWDYSCSRSRSTFVLCGISQTQYGKEFWIILAQEVCRCRMEKNLGLFVLKKSEYFCALWGLAAAVTGYNFGLFVLKKSVLLCFVGSRRCSMGKNFELFLLKKSEYFCALWGLADAVCMGKNFGLFVLTKSE